MRNMWNVTFLKMLIAFAISSTVIYWIQLVGELSNSGRVIEPPGWFMVVAIAITLAFAFINIVRDVYEPVFGEEEEDPPKQRR